jgi:hypothetical protein
VDSLGVGVPVITGPPAGWNFWPVLGIPLAWIVAFRWLRLPRTLWTAIAVTVLGLLTADAVAAWGVIPAGASVALVLAATAVGLRLARRSHPPNV